MGKKTEKKIGPMTKEESEKKAQRKAAKKVRRVAQKGKKAVKVASAPINDKVKKGGAQLYSAPVAVGGSVKSYFRMANLPGSGGMGIRAQGCDFLTTVTVPTSAVAGQVQWNMPMNPTALVGTRLATMAGLYEKYRFNRFIVRAIPQNSTSYSGGYGLAYDRDPTDATPPSGDEGIRQFMAMPSTQIANAWAPLTLDCKMMSPETCYFTNITSGSDERLVDQGQLYFFATGTPTQALTFFLEVEFDISMWVPEIGPSLTSGTVKISAPSASAPSFPVLPTNLLNIFQTGYSTWAAPSFNGSVGPLGQLLYALIPSGSLGTGSNYGIRLPGGIWQIARTLHATGDTSTGWGAGAGFGAPQFQADNPKEQSEFLYSNQSLWNTLSSVTVGGTYNISRDDDILVPPSGGWLALGQNAITTAANTGTTAASLFLSILPTRTQPAWAAALGKTGKFRTPLIEQLKPKVREWNEKMEENARLDGLIEEREMGHLIAAPIPSAKFPSSLTLTRPK